MLKGVFTRKDNGKQLTTTRTVQGDELTQVQYIYTSTNKGAKNAYFCIEHTVSHNKRQRYYLTKYESRSCE